MLSYANQPNIYCTAMTEVSSPLAPIKKRDKPICQNGELVKVLCSFGPDHLTPTLSL